MELTTSPAWVMTPLQTSPNCVLGEGLGESVPVLGGRRGGWPTPTLGTLLEPSLSFVTPSVTYSTGKRDRDPAMTGCFPGFPVLLWHLSRAQEEGVFQSAGDHVDGALY